MHLWVGGQWGHEGLDADERIKTLKDRDTRKSPRTGTQGNPPGAGIIII